MKGLATLRHLALPLHAAPLLLVTIFAVLLRLAVYGGLLGLPALLIIGSWFFKYAFLLLDHAANGRPGAPVLSVEDANPLGEVRPLLYGAGAGVFYMATGALGSVVGPELVSGLRLLGLLVLPAIVATHSITGSFTEAISPATIIRVIWRLGAGYPLVLFVALACGWAGRAIVLDGGHLDLLLRIALLMLLWLAMFAVLGGLIHDRRLELGSEPEQSPERRECRDERDRERERDHFIDQVFAEYRAGSRGNPWASIQARAMASPSPVSEYAWPWIASLTGRDIRSPTGSHWSCCPCSSPSVATARRCGSSGPACSRTRTSVLARASLCSVWSNWHAMGANARWRARCCVTSMDTIRQTRRPCARGVSPPTCRGDVPRAESRNHSQMQARHPSRIH